MPFRRGAQHRVLPVGFVVALLLLFSVPPGVLGAEWSPAVRVTSQRGSRLDSLHQLSADRGIVHLVHPRIGSGRADDRVIYQRSTNGGARWSSERSLFSATSTLRHVVPNLALDVNGRVVAVAWRVRGDERTTLFVRVSQDGGLTFGDRRIVTTSRHGDGLGVPAVAVGRDVIAVAWTDRANGKVMLRVSRNGGRSWKSARTMGRTRLSIDCRRRVVDGLVGLAAADKRVHVAWSHAPTRSCIARAVRVRSSADHGRSWSRRRTATTRRSYGWPELAARGRTVVATMQSPGGRLIVASSRRNGRAWTDRVIRARKGHSLSAADIELLPRGRAIISYVDERISKSRLVATRVIARRSRDDGRRFGTASVIAPMARRLRMAPNIAADDVILVVYQAGALDGAPRDLFASRSK